MESRQKREVDQHLSQRGEKFLLTIRALISFLKGILFINFYKNLIYSIHHFPPN